MLSTEDETCFNIFARFIVYSITLLPFSTGFMLFKSSIFHFHNSLLLSLFFSIPTLVGWVSLVVCLPTFLLETAFD